MREIANFVFKKAVLKSSAYSDLGKAIDSFNKEFSQESTTDDFSLNGLVKDINKQIENWEITFGFRIGTLKPEDIVKNLLSHYVTDKNLQDSEVHVDNLGQGLLRLSPFLLVFIATIINYFVDNSPINISGLLTSKEFPQFNLLTFFIYNFIFFGFGEEVGWRGFTLPRLQNKFNALTSSIILTIF